MLLEGSLFFVRRLNNRSIFTIARVTDRAGPVTVQWTRSREVAHVCRKSSLSRGGSFPQFLQLGKSTQGKQLGIGDSICSKHTLLSLSEQSSALTLRSPYQQYSYCTVSNLAYGEGPFLRQQEIKQLHAKRDEALLKIEMSEFDPTIFEDFYNRKEDVPELKLSDKITAPEVLEQIQNATKGKPKLLPRGFVAAGVAKVNDSHDSVESSSTFRVMQWNCLAQGLSSGKDNFVRCPAGALSWEYRRLRMLEEILRTDADIVCMQEVDHYGFLRPSLAAVGYEGFFFPKPDSPCIYTSCSNGPDGCAIFYKTDKFSEVSQKSFILKQDSDQFETNQVCVSCHFQSNANPEHRVTVATTHLKAKTGWHQLRQDQGTYLSKQLAEDNPDVPLIVCGDFNADPKEGVYQVFARSPLGLSSAYTLLSGDPKKEPQYTTWKIRGKFCGEVEVCHAIDYIWYTRKSLAVSGLLSLPSGEEMGDDRLPSFQYPSDHIALAADFTFLSSEDN